MTANKPPARKRIAITFDMPEKIGDELFLERPIDGLEIFIVRKAPKPLSFADFVVVTADPSGNNRDLHVARKTDAPSRARVVSTIFCTEETNRPIRTGQRLDVVPIGSVTCAQCQNKLLSLGLAPTKKGQ